MWIVLAALIFIILTILTEVGGIIFLASVFIGGLIQRYTNVEKAFGISASFILLYCVSTFILLPIIAPVFGRVPLNCFASDQHSYEANSSLYCLLNRHYVDPKMKFVLEDLSQNMAIKYPGTIVSYLGANFPFLDWMPLLPHLSHNDGKKLDIAFFYKQDEKPMHKGGGWFLGYWVFSPSWSAANVSIQNKQDGLLRWEMYWLQGLFSDLSLDHARNTDMLRFVSQGKTSLPVQRVFIEPYLKDVLNVHSNKIGFAGFNAARHDDHIHIQVF